MSMEARITVRTLTDFATGEKTPLRVLLLRDNAKELSEKLDKMNEDAKKAVKELGCSTVAVRITTLFYDGQQLSEDRALGFHRPPDFTKALAEGSHLDVVSNPEVYACLQAISQEMQFASDNMVRQDCNRTCPRCGAESTEQPRQDFDDLQKWKFCPKPWGDSQEGGRCGFPLLTPGQSFNKNRCEIAAQECRRFFANGYSAHPAPARLPGSDLEDDAAAEELFDEAMAKLVAYLDNRKQKLHPAVAFLLRKYLLELQELKWAPPAPPRIARLHRASTVPAPCQHLAWTSPASRLYLACICRSPFCACTPPAFRLYLTVSRLHLTCISRCEYDDDMAADGTPHPEVERTPQVHATDLLLTCLGPCRTQTRRATRSRPSRSDTSRAPRCDSRPSRRTC